MDRSEFVAIKKEYYDALLELEKSTKMMLNKVEKGGVDSSDCSKIQNRFLWKVQQSLQGLE